MFSTTEIGSRRLDHCQVIFSDENVSAQEKEKEKNINLDNLFWDMEKVLTSEAKTWWDKTGLEQYLKTNRVPRGLRITKLPTFGQNDEAFMNAWDTIMNECSRKLMELIINEKNKQLLVVKKVIEEKEAILKEYENMEDFKTNKSVLLEKMEKIETKIKDNKAKKFKRDKLDYTTGRIRKWSKFDSLPKYSQPSQKSYMKEIEGGNWIRIFPKNKDDKLEGQRQTERENKEPVVRRKTTGATNHHIWEKDEMNDNNDFLAQAPYTSTVRRKTLIQENIRKASPLKRTLREEEEEEEEEPLRFQQRKKMLK